MSSRFIDPSEFWAEANRRSVHWQMNIYDLLRALVNGDLRTQEQREGAIGLINDLEQIGVFGSTAATIERKGET